MPPEEYQSIMNAMATGFAGVHSRIDTFKDEFSNHQIVCQKLFGEISSTAKVQQAVEKERAEEKRRGIDWGKVKTALTIAVGSLLTIAAVKIIFTNIGKVPW